MAYGEERGAAKLSGHDPFHSKQVFLRSSVKIEPLVDRWYAWPHLMAPAQQAMNLAFRYLPIARSFVSAPAAHIAAAADPAMFGGPFLDLPASAVESVNAYVVETESRRAQALSFARAFREFDMRLRSLTGYSLDEAREQAPEALRGLVELSYDLDSHAGIRILEEMFQEDDMGHQRAQQIMLHTTTDGQRPFFLSTPRIETAGSLLITTSFGSDAAKSLCAARTNPVDLGDLAAVLGQSVDQLAPFFTEEQAPSRAAFSGEGVRVSYFGHACLLIESSDLTILVDPTAAHEKIPGVEHLTFEDLPKRIDVVLISHGHQDHFSIEMLMQLRDRVDVVLIPPCNLGNLADPSLLRMLLSLGYTRVHTLMPLESFPVRHGQITALPFSGEHCDLNVHSKQCALIELRGRKICLFIDSDAIDLDVYSRLSGRLAEPDLLFVGMECFGAPLTWLYGPLLSTPPSRKNDNSRRLSGANCHRALRLTETLRPRKVFVYAMGQEPWMKYLMGLSYQEDSIQLRESQEFVERCCAAGIPAARLHMRMVEEL